jgi:hypothetical protein
MEQLKNTTMTEKVDSSEVVIVGPNACSQFAATSNRSAFADSFSLLRPEPFVSSWSAATMELIVEQPADMNTDRY